MVSQVKNTQFDSAIDCKQQNISLILTLKTFFYHLHS